MSANLILIGMPGAGKSTVGVILAKLLSMDFIDTDILIQRKCICELQTIVNTQGYLTLRAIEEEVITALSANSTVIATGGSAVYSATAMSHLRKNGTVVYLKLAMRELVSRLHNFATRGIASPPAQTFRSLFTERSRLYREYADVTIDCSGKSQDAVAEEIAESVTTL